MSGLPGASHRPWPLPRSPWVLAMTWSELLFAHWPVDAARVAPHVPPGLELERFDGKAWMGVVPFRMRGTRPRGLPPLPGLGSFPELNVRTYVRAGGKPGIWFFSLDAGSPLAVAAARWSYSLPYFRARMRIAPATGGGVEYASERTHAGAAPAALACAYRAVGPAVEATPGSLEQFLAERYCLYARRSGGALLRADIHHAPWRLAPAEAEWRRDTMCAAAGVPVAGAPPFLHRAEDQRTFAWLPRRVGSAP